MKTWLAAKIAAPIALLLLNGSVWAQCGTVPTQPATGDTPAASVTAGSGTESGAIGDAMGAASVSGALDRAGDFIRGTEGDGGPSLPGGAWAGPGLIGDVPGAVDGTGGGLAAPPGGANGGAANVMGGPGARVAAIVLACTEPWRNRRWIGVWIDWLEGEIARVREELQIERDPKEREKLQRQFDELQSKHRKAQEAEKDLAHEEHPPAEGGDGSGGSGGNGGSSGSGGSKNGSGTGDWHPPQDPDHGMGPIQFPPAPPDDKGADPKKDDKSSGTLDPNKSPVQNFFKP